MIKRVPIDELEAACAEIERTGRIVEIVCPNDAVAIIRYETKRTAPGGKETR